MNSGTEEIPLSQISTDLTKEIGQSLANHSVGFVKVEKGPGGETATLAGSGTLITANDVSAIITAHHVARELPRERRLGLVLSSKLPSHTVDPRELRFIDVGRASANSADGPDIAALVFACEYRRFISREEVFLQFELPARPIVECATWNGSWYMDIARLCRGAYN